LSSEVDQHDDVAAVLARLEQMTTDLGAYVRVRAEEVAAPRIRAAKAAAAKKVKVAEAQAMHWKDVAEELRRHVDAALSSQHTTLHEVGRMHEPEFCRICKRERGEK
jgi:Asp-tRNA(Asn)/Glu-tRNA(Gln) amidotransferase A subunit family amidase